MNARRKRILYTVKQEIQKVDCIVSARAYGSWLYNELSTDIDIAAIVSSKFGVIARHHYGKLRELRILLSEMTGQDIDLVPHTEDEFADRNSPLWYPRYNPSLVFGRNLKGDLHIAPVSASAHLFSFADLTAYVLHDNRTICRRQLVRSFSGETGRIFVSKLLHGPGNALTYRACRDRTNYVVPPSNLDECFSVFDRTYGVNSSAAITFLLACKKDINFRRGVLLMNWYENLFNVVIHGDQFKNGYQRLCRMLGGR